MSCDPEADSSTSTCTTTTSWPCSWTEAPGIRELQRTDSSVPSDGKRFDEDPALGPTTSRAATTAPMGDIISCDGAVIEVIVHAASPIERIEVRDGPRGIITHRPYGADDTGNRLRIVWEGARNRGRGRMVAWDGHIALDTAEIVSWNVFKDATEGVDVSCALLAGDLRMGRVV